jgi:pyruvate dehydrogenase E2 component (dihydrolipoamide acetyltransferase)
VQGEESKEANVYEVTMPKLSDSMEEGKIIEWKVKEGDQVREGDVLAEVESDKAVMELECFRDGTMAEIRYEDEAEVTVGEVIALIRLAGEEAEAPEKEPEEVPPKEEAEEAPEAEAEQKEEEEEEAGPPEEEAEEAPAEEAAPVAEEGERVRVSPYARKLAEERGVDVSRLEGSGPGGRIIARDVEEAAEGAPPAEAEREEPETAAPARPAADEELPPIEVAEGEAEVEDAPFRLKTQARRVMASQHVIPHFYVTRGADVTELLARKDGLKEQYGATVTHLVMLACVKALKEHPDVNRSYDRGRIIKWNGIHLGLAVDTDEGLTVAVVRNAGDLSLGQLVERTGELVERARAGKLSAEDRRHPTLTITNLGMFDVEHFEPIINPPSAVTLAVASALPAPLARGDAIYVGRLMKLTAACDHRIIDGATAARFLGELRGLLEDPDRLLEGQ